MSSGNTLYGAQKDDMRARLCSQIGWNIVGDRTVLAAQLSSWEKSRNMKIMLRTQFADVSSSFHDLERAQAGWLVVLSPWPSTVLSMMFLILFLDIVETSAQCQKATFFSNISKKCVCFITIMTKILLISSDHPKKLLISVEMSSNYSMVTIFNS